MVRKTNIHCYDGVLLNANTLTHVGSVPFHTELDCAALQRCSIPEASFASLNWTTVYFILLYFNTPACTGALLRLYN